MKISRATFFSALLIASATHADSIGDIRAAIAPLRATTPIRASYDLQRTRRAEGRFANQTTNATVGVEVTSDLSGLHMTFPPALLDRVAREEREHQADPKKPVATRGALADIDAVALAECLDFREVLLRLLAYAKPLNESRVAFRGATARLVVLKLSPPMPKEATSVFHVTFDEDRLNVWLGADNVPIAAERHRKGSAGFLFLHGEMTTRESWNFIRSEDRLVVTKYESTFAGSGFGQRSEGRDVRTLTVR